MLQIEKDLLAFAKGSKIALSLADAGTADFPLVFVNEAFSDLTGYSHEECVGQNCRFLQGDLGPQPGVEIIRDFLEKPEREFARATLVNVRKSGERFVNLLLLARLKDLNKSTRYFFASQFDIGDATEVDLEKYDLRLLEQIDEADEIASSHRLVFHGSLQSLADGAARIAQAKLTLAQMTSDAAAH